MSILIVGADGSMGKRYQCILKYLGRDFQCVDQDNTLVEIECLADRSDGIIIATPTDTHVKFIRKFLPFRKPILCEKPVTKDISLLKTLRDEIEESHTPFRMMLQYEMLSPSMRIGRSHYNYFRHGSDGLVWDCMQIIGLARRDVFIGETSPVWSCALNGKTLSLNHMDAAYIAYVQRWFASPHMDFHRILHVHAKTAEYQNGFH